MKWAREVTTQTLNIHKPIYHLSVSADPTRTGSLLTVWLTVSVLRASPTFLFKQQQLWLTNSPFMEDIILCTKHFQPITTTNCTHRLSFLFSVLSALLPGVLLNRERTQHEQNMVSVWRSSCWRMWLLHLWNISTPTGWIGTTFCNSIYGSQMMNDFCDPLTSLLAPPLSSHLWFWAKCQLLDGLPWNWVQTFVFPSGWVLTTLVTSWIFTFHHLVKISICPSSLVYSWIPTKLTTFPSILSCALCF